MPGLPVASFGPIRARRSFEEVLDRIAGAIRAGDLRAGDRLPPERALASLLGVSRPTLREAVRTLVEAGALEVRPGRAGGTFVRSEVVPRGALGRPPRLRAEEGATVLETRRVLEPQVAQIAALHADERDFAALAEVIALHERAPSRAHVGQFDLRFHLAIARATKNPRLVTMVDLLQGDLEVLRDLAVRDPFDATWTVTIHRATLEAIRSRDPDRIAAVMDEHLSFLERVWQEETGLELRSPA
jgi:GntR family transcriptional regulator, transcriptional repressor for pyruvate dehydrogenase complex